MRTWPLNKSLFFELAAPDLDDRDALAVSRDDSDRAAFYRERMSH
jgi:hypothetical protein